MAIKDSYTPKPAAPKIPAVIAKPAPVTRKGESGGYSGIPTTIAKPVETKKSSSGLSAADRAELLKDFNQAQKMLGDITKDRDALLDQYKKGLGGGDDGTGGLGGGQQAPTEDAGLAYSKMQDEKARQDAFAILKDVFASYGLSDLATEIEGYMREGIGTSQATLKLKQSQAYKDRFYGNELRLAAGRNVVNEAEYLDLENSYSETLKAYGLQDYFGIGVTPVERKNRQKAIASVIGNDISAVEFKDRVSTAIDRVKMADPATKNAFQQFYGIGEAELAKYFLDPTKTLVTLKEKATAAEIGGAAIGQGLAATATSAEDLARFGVDRQQAQAGYAQIGEELPTAGSLGRIYSESGITYNQADAESATFKGLASARRKKEQLKQLEEGQFSGSSGTALGQSALSTQYLRRGSSSGQF
jgi:hypothetical protein